MPWSRPNAGDNWQQNNSVPPLEDKAWPTHIFSITVAVRRAALGFKGAARSAPVVFNESLQKRREESVLCAKTFFVWWLLLAFRAVKRRTPRLHDTFDRAAAFLAGLAFAAIDQKVMLEISDIAIGLFVIA